MCISTPVKIIKINGGSATVLNNGRERKVSIPLIKNPKIKDWLLVHANLAIKKISKKEAEEIIKIIETAKE